MLYSNYKMLNINVRSHPSDKLLFPQVKQPLLVGEYSVSTEGHYENSGSQIRFLDKLSLSTCPISLKATVDMHQEDDEQHCSSPRYLDNMFLFLGSSTDKLHMLLDHDIICTRAVLELLMCSPYDFKKNWTIAVSRYRNTIYMCQVQNEEFGLSHFDQEHLKKLIKATWMKNLRQHCLEPTAENTIRKETHQQTNECGQYYGVFSMDIIGIRLLFDAPVVAEHSLNPFKESTKTLVDLQMRLDTMTRAEWTVHNRTEVLVWWVQCFLVGIEKIYLAYYDEDALVHRIKNTTVRELWEECKSDWSPNLCANFLARFLSTIKKLIAPVDCASLVYLFEYDAKSGIITYKVSEERNEHSFIPDWFRIMCDEPMDHLNAAVRFQNEDIIMT